MALFLETESGAAINANMVESFEVLGNVSKGPRDIHTQQDADEQEGWWVAAFGPERTVTSDDVAVHGAWDVTHRFDTQQQALDALKQLLVWIRNADGKGVIFASNYIVR